MLDPIPITINRNYFNYCAMLPIRATSSAPKLYKQLCKQYNRPINNEIKTGLSETEFFLKVDLIGKVPPFKIWQADLDPIFSLLRQCKFRAIVLQGGSDGIESSRKLNRSTVHVPNSRLFSVTPEFMALIKSFSLTIGKSLDLVSFGIRDVRLSNEAIQLLGHGIQTAQSLKELELRSCSLSTQSLALIEFALSQNSSLIAIDLQRNFLTEGSGLIIQRVLDEHCARRDRLEWVYKSRGETPEDDVSLNGICEINLSYNRLDTGFIKDLELRNDRWLKSLNLRGNIIDEDGLQTLNDILDVNQALLSLDVRDNTGVTTKLSKSIFAKLVRNMNNLKEQNSLLANVSAIPRQDSSSSASYQHDQESPMISFGDRLLEQNITKQNSQSSKKELIKKKLMDEDAVAHQCSQCSRYMQQLKTAQQVISLLKQENQMLRQQTRPVMDPIRQHYSFQQHSTSNVLNNLWQTEPQSQPPGEQEDMINRIEQMMSELTRMMDSLENQNSATNNNLTAHLSSTIIGANNNTHLIYPRDQMIAEPPFMNILEGNNSNIQQPHNESFE